MNHKRPLLARIELFFWDFAIRMLSHSRSTRSILRGAASLSSPQGLVSLVAGFLAVGLAGLASGFLFYYIDQLSLIR